MTRPPVFIVGAFVGAALHADSVNRAAGAVPSQAAPAAIRGPVQDESLSCQPFDRAGMDEIEGRVRTEMARPDDGDGA